MRAHAQKPRSGGERVRPVPVAPPLSGIAALQRTAGNRAVAGAIARMRIKSDGTGAEPTVEELVTIGELLTARDADPFDVTATRLDDQLTDWRDLTPAEVIARLREPRKKRRSEPSATEQPTKHERETDPLAEIFPTEAPAVSERLAKAIARLTLKQLQILRRLADVHGAASRTLFATASFGPAKLNAMVAFPEVTLADLAAANVLASFFILQPETITAAARLLDALHVTRIGLPWIQLAQERDAEACSLMRLPGPKLAPVDGFVNVCDMTTWLTLPKGCVASVFGALPNGHLSLLFARPPADVLALCGALAGAPGTLDKIARLRSPVFTALVALTTPNLLMFASLNQRVLGQFAKNDETHQLRLMNDAEIASMATIEALESGDYTPAVAVSTSLQHSLEEHGAHLTDTDVASLSSSANKPKGRWASAVVHEKCITWALANCSPTYFHKRDGRWSPNADLDAVALGLTTIGTPVGHVLDANRWRATTLFRVVLEVDDTGGLHPFTAYPA